MSISFYNIEESKILNLEIPDIYFTSKYGKACEYSDNAIWECCVYNDLIYVYLKKPINYNGIVYYELLTPYGYSGYNFKKEITLNEFIKIFKEYAIKRNYISEIVRQNPYINLDISMYYKIISNKNIYAISINSFDDYYNNVLNSKKRNMYMKAIKNNLSFKIEKLEKSKHMNDFLNLYSLTMDKLNAKKYYYFNKEYFDEISKIDNSYLAIVFDKNNIVIGCSIIFIYENFVHYHLSCNNNSMNCITDYLICNVVKEVALNKLFILGGGLSQSDSLCKFKKSLSNKEFNYKIFKNIINESVYNNIYIE